MKKVTLISPPWFFAHPRDIITPSNLGIGYIASYLESKGHRVTVIQSLAEGYQNIKKIKGRYKDFYQIGLDYEQILKKIPTDSDFIGISAPFTNHSRIVKELAAVIKNTFLETPIILGGAYPSLILEGALCGEIDLYVVGEGEKALYDLILGRNTEEIKGVFAFGRLPENRERAEIVDNLDDLPFPKRDRLNITHISSRKERLRAAAIITSRGCPFDCNFCSIHLICGQKWRSRSAKNVLEEIRALIKEFDIEHIEFEDDNLTLDRDRAMFIFEGINKINKDIKRISWSTPNGVRVDSMDREMLSLIKRSGCRSLSLGVESGDQAILRRMGKKLDLNKVIEIVRICKEFGIKTNIFLMIGYPGEDQESFCKTILFVKRLKMEGADFYTTITRAYPGTALFKSCQEDGYLSAQGMREDIFLGNILTPGNAIITPDFNSKILRKRLITIERLTIPFYLRFYHRYFHLIKKIMPDSIIQNIKRVLIR